MYSNCIVLCEFGLACCDYDSLMVVSVIWYHRTAKTTENGSINSEILWSNILIITYYISIHYYYVDLVLLASTVAPSACSTMTICYGHSAKKRYVTDKYSDCTKLREPASPIGYDALPSFCSSVQA